MNYILCFLLFIVTLQAMEPVEDESFQHPTRQEPMPYLPNGGLMPIADDIENQNIRIRSGTISSEESQFESQMNDIMLIFSDVQKIEDEQYIKSVIEVLSRERKETYHSISPYLSTRLRASYNEVRELTEARKRSSLKKFMKQLIADSINDAFIRVHYKHEEEMKVATQNVKRSRLILAGVIATGLSTTLAAFFAAYFGHGC